jgi:hypothetical protein
MKITCTRAVMASGKALEAGQIYDVSDKDGALLIGMGKAVEAKVEEPKPKRTRKPKTDGVS